MFLQALFDQGQSVLNKFVQRRNTWQVLFLELCMLSVKMHFVNQNCGLYGCKRFEISSMVDSDYINIHIIVHIDTYSVCMHICNIYIYVIISVYVYTMCVCVCLFVSLFLSLYVRNFSNHRSIKTAAMAVMPPHL